MSPLSGQVEGRRLPDAVLAVDDNSTVVSHQLPHHVHRTLLGGDVGARVAVLWWWGDEGEEGEKDEKN